MTALPFSRLLTPGDLEDLPRDDGHRYELIDGLFREPGAAVPAQEMVGNPYLLLRAGYLAHLKVVLRPFAVVLAEDTEVRSYQAAGIASRWLVDPLEVTVTVLELHDGRYEQVALGTGGQTVEVSLPGPMTFTAASLQDWAPAAPASLDARVSPVRAAAAHPARRWTSTGAVRVPGRGRR